MITRITSFVCGGFLAASMAFAVPCQAANLFGHNGFGTDSPLYSIDTGVPAANFIGMETRNRIPEIEIDPTGSVIYAGLRAGSELYSIDPATGLTTDTLALSFPAEYNSITAMQFVGNTLYGALTNAGAQMDSAIATIDTTTGVVTTIGDTTLAPPLGGLAYDNSTSTLYGVTTTGSFDSQLVTIDSSTGVGSVVATMTLGGNAQRSITGLEFGSDGVLYAVATTSPGALFEVDPATAVMTNLGDLGAVMTSITAGIEASLACDFDGSSTCDVDDVNMMLAIGPINVGVPVTPGTEQFDLDQDGTINNNDLNQWLADAATENGLGSPYKGGDANLDGTVDGQDFIAWNASKFQTTLNWNEGNFNGDSAVDGQDFIVWNTNKFTTSDAAVPEPASSLLVCSIGLILARLRRQK